MPSLINTDATKEMGGDVHGLALKVAAKEIYNGISDDHFENFVGKAGQQYADYFEDPRAATAKFNRDYINRISYYKQS